MRIPIDREQVEPIFSTPIGYYKYPDDKHAELKDAVRAAISRVNTGPSDWSANLYHFYQHNNEHLLYDNDDPPFQDFHDWLEECYADFVIDLQGWNTTQFAFITDCWVNITKEGGSQVIHTHANAFVSGTYYLHMEEGAGPIIFMNPCAQPSRPYIGFDTTKTTQFNCTQWYGNCEEMRLLLWPGHIAHLTQPTQKGATRTSISMNFMPKNFTAGAYNYKVVKTDQQGNIDES
tara:strand:- start:6655 stop:7353 length:699 start_codon:yes stop_codon:yes gene_type:complete